MLCVKPRPAADLVVRGARVLEPARQVDAVMDVRVDGGFIAQLGEDLPANGHRVIDAAGRVLAPAFVDPHVHLRTPGREDEETIASGTHAARGRWRRRRSSRRADRRRAPRGRPPREAAGSSSGSGRATGPRRR